MRIIHSGITATTNSVDGINIGACLVAREQARQGHDVYVHLPTDDAAEGFKVIIENEPLPFGLWRGGQGLLAVRPDIVHVHRGYVPAHVGICRMLRKADVPYLITPHGAWAFEGLDRGRTKKHLYNKILEPSRVNNAAGISALTRVEVKEIQNLFPDFRGLLRIIAEPVDPEGVERHPWSPSEHAPIVFFGRFDMQMKGIDLALQVAERLPEIEFHFYGVATHRTPGGIENLRRIASPNAKFLDPVFGNAKRAILSKAQMYLHLARWEGFPLALAEAMLLGVPSIALQGKNFTLSIANRDLALLVPEDADVAADSIRKAYGTRSKLNEWSVRAQEFVKESFAVQRIAAEYLSFYKQVLSSQT